MSSKLRLRGAPQVETRDLLIATIVLIVAATIAAGVYAHMTSVSRAAEGVASFGSGENLILLIWSPTCSHCQKVLPTWRKLEEEQPLARLGWRLADVSIQNPQAIHLVETIGAEWLPIVVFLKSGRPVYFLQGWPDKPDTKYIVNELLAQLQSLGLAGSTVAVSSAAKAIGVVGAFILGLIIGISPCVLPLIAAYAAAGASIASRTCALAVLASSIGLGVAAALAGSILASAMPIVVAVAASLLAAFGVTMLLGASVAPQASRGARLSGAAACAAIPVLGAQCSLPALIGGLAGVSAAASIAAGVAFGVGLALPVIAVIAASRQVALRLAHMASKLEKVAGAVMLLIAVVMVAGWW